MGLTGSLEGDLELLWPIFVVGFVLFAIFYAGRAASARAGQHLGVAGIGLVLVVGAAGLWWLGYVDVGLLVGLLGLVLAVAGLRGKDRG